MAKHRKTATNYAVWRLFADRPGLSDYLGSISAPHLSAAEVEAERQYGPLAPDEYFDIEVDDE